MENPNLRETLYRQLETRFAQMIEDINQMAVSLDLSDCMKTNNNGSPVNLCDLIKGKSHIGSIVIEFDEASQLTHCGGV